MSTSKGILFGIIYGCCLSFCLSIIFMMFALGFAFGGFSFLFSGSWIYSATMILFILTLVLFGFYFTIRKNEPNGKFQFISLLSKLSALLFCLSFVFFLVTQGLSGGFTSLLGERWLYFATPIPFILTFAILGFYFTQQEKVSNKKFWLISLLSALFITLFSGTIGALFGEYVVRGGSLRTYVEGGYTGVNVEGVLIWGTIYAFIFLPLTIPLARLVIQVFYEVIKKCKCNPKVHR